MCFSRVIWHLISPLCNFWTWNDGSILKLRIDALHIIVECLFSLSCNFPSNAYLLHKFSHVSCENLYFYTRQILVFTVSCAMYKNWSYLCLLVYQFVKIIFFFIPYPFMYTRVIESLNTIFFLSFFLNIKSGRTMFVHQPNTTRVSFSIVLNKFYEYKYKKFRSIILSEELNN